MNRHISPLKGIAVFSSTVIGAGILALPVAAARSGFFPLLLILILMAITSVFSALYISEAVLCTEGSSHLPSLAGEYLGSWGMGAMILGTMIYIYGALVGYLAAGGQLLFYLSEGSIPIRLGTVVYFAITAVIIHCGVIWVSYVETYLFSVMLVLLGSVIVLALPEINLPFLSDVHWTSSSDVFGVVLFAYIGHSVIPSIANNLERKRDIVRIAFWGITIPFFLYVVWSLVVIGIVPSTSQTGYSLAEAKAAGQPATIPLGMMIGGSVILLGNVFAVVSTMTSYIGFGLSLKDEYANIAGAYRKRISSYGSTLLVVLPPLIMALFNPGVFIRTLDIAGTYGGGLFVGILPSLMVIRLQRMNVSRGFHAPGGGFMPYVILGTYLAGIVYTTVQFIVGRT